jgi:hypothetical protein
MLSYKRTSQRSRRLKRSAFFDIGMVVPTKSHTNWQDMSQKPGLPMDTVDFSKKILHGSWHPRENTVAVRNVILLQMQINQPH